jgi:hypothetical protein
MVAALYTRLEATAKRLIAKYGKAAVLVRETKTGPAHDPSVVETPYSCMVADIGYSITDRDASLVQVGDKVGLMSTAVEVTPEKGDKLQIDGGTYSFVDLKPLNPGGLVLLYEYHARK